MRAALCGAAYVPVRGAAQRNGEQPRGATDRYAGGAATRNGEQPRGGTDRYVRGAAQRSGKGPPRRRSRVRGG
ncbi:hypothetical protein JCM4914_59260 [Streptomyces platensis subsp. malvinus]